MRWPFCAAAYCCVLAVSAAGSTPALTTIRLPGRTSLVFDAGAAQAPRVVQISGREIRASVPVSIHCEPARYRAGAPDSAIDSVEVRCPTSSTAEAVVRTRRDVLASGRSTGAHFYLDVVIADGSAAIAARAASLAAAGNVRELMALIDTLSPGQRSAVERGGPSLAGLLERARERQLQVDRELLLGSSQGSR